MLAQRLLPMLPNEPPPESRHLSREVWEGHQIYRAMEKSALDIAISTGIKGADGRAWDFWREEEELRRWAVLIAQEILHLYGWDEVIKVHKVVQEETGKLRARSTLPFEGAPDPPPLPKRYGLTDNAVFLRICERFGLDPFRAAGVPRDDPGMWMLLGEWERARGAPENPGPRDAQPGAGRVRQEGAGGFPAARNITHGGYHGDIRP